MKTAEPEAGQSTVVLGCGCIGLVTILVLKSRGIHDIYTVDVIEKRLDKAKEAGAEVTTRCPMYSILKI